jgi:hypothetical protein
LGNLIIIFIPIVVFGLVLTFSKGKVAEFLSNPTTIYATLILWTWFGFVFVLDNSMAWGCLTGTQEVFSFGNIAYSGLSVLFITIGFFSWDKKGLIILFGELIYWTAKFMAAKGGYAVGLGRTPDENILMFDSVALTLRLLLIQSRIDFVLTKKALLLLPVSFLLMTLKILFMR